MLSSYFYRETRVWIMMVLVVVVAGVSSLWTLGRQEDPTITNLYATVTTLLPGADAARVEALISKRIEDEIQGIADIEYFSSSSLKSASVVSVMVRETLAKDEIDQVWVSLREAVAVASASFPPDALPPQIDTEGVAAYSTVVAVTLEDPDFSIAMAGRFAETLATTLRDIPKTRVVRNFGMPQEEILVSLDPYLAGARGFSADQVASAISTTDGRALAGRLVSGGLDANVSVSGEINQIDQIRSIPVTSGALENVVRVGDIATVSREVRDPPASLGYANGRPAILVAAVVEDGAQVDRWMSYVREDVETAAKRAPLGLGVSVLFDQSIYTVERLTDVGLNMLFGIGLVTLVLIFTLGLRAAAIVAVILPLVTLATLATLKMLSLPLHQMSVTGLIVSLGLVVDAAIVTTDTVRRRLLAGKRREEAAANASNRLFLPLAASTVTTVLTFLPMILLPGNAGDFVGTIAIAVTAMLFWSFAFAIVLTAPLAARFLHNYATPTQRLRSMAPNSGILHKAMCILIRNPVISISLSFVLPVLGFILATQLTPQFFPLVERNQFHISVELPGYTAVTDTAALIRQVDSEVLALEGVTGSYWIAGGSAPAFYYNIPGGRANESGYAQGMFTTQTPEDTHRILQSLQQDLTDDFPEARIIVQRLSQGPPVGAPVEIYIYGPELDELRRIGAQVQGAIARLPEASQVRAGLTGGLPQIRYDIDSDAAKYLSLNEASIARQLEAGLSGTISGALVEGTKLVPIRVRFDEGTRTSSTAINDLPIVTLLNRASITGLPIVPLSAIASPRFESTEALIFRSDGERMNYVQAYPQPDVLPEIVLQKALTAIEEANIVIPPGYSWDIGGESDGRSDTVSGLLSSTLLIVTLSLATLVVTFRSFRLTIGTAIVAFLSAGLALFSVSIMGFPFGINALIGVIGSIGVSINAAIIVFTALQGNKEALAGDVDAAASEVLNGASHIISTTLTTFGGFLPLLFSGGLFWPPFAAAISGGVLLSGTLAFMFAPAFFCAVYAGRRSAQRFAEEVEDAPAGSNDQSDDTPPAAAQYGRDGSRDRIARPIHPLRRFAASQARTRNRFAKFDR